MSTHVLKDAPVLAVGTVTLFGVQLNDLVLIATAVYTLIRIVIEVDNWWQRRNDRNSAVPTR